MIKPFAFVGALLATALLCINAQAQTFEIRSARASGTVGNFDPSNVIDGDLSFRSNWIGNGNPQEVRLDLGSDKRVDNVQIAWGRGRSNVYQFEIAGRSGTSGPWTTIFSGSSSGNTNDFEDYNVNDIDARQVRIRGLDAGFTNITEVKIIGTGGDSGPILPEADIVFSTASNRTSPRAIEGAQVSNDIYVLLDQDHDDDVKQVRFYINDRFVRQQNFAPFDLRGGARVSARRFRTTNLEDGAYAIRADIIFDDRSTYSVTRNFTIDNSNSGNNNSGNGDGIDFGLNPNLPPQDNFDLSDWAIDTPAPRPDDPCRAERTNENEYDDISPESAKYFFTHTDGGMRFVTRVDGATTNRSCNSGFPRSELREMLRAGATSISTTGVNPNNWALGYQPEGGNYGGRNGVLTATLRVNKVTTTGNGLHPGRTIIGQIHADDDEPVRVYYRKLPNDTRGCIYLSHERREGSETDIAIVGGDENCSNPADGIALDELFSYEIINEGAEIRVIVRRGDFDGPVIGDEAFDMNDFNSNYDRADEWMYFKLGAYTQNNTGVGDDGDIITFYRINNSHDPN